MNDIVSSAAIIVMWTVVYVAVAARLRGPERAYIGGAFLMHLVFAFALYAVMEWVFGVTDVHVYMINSESSGLGRLMRDDPGRWGPELFKVIFRLPNSLPLPDISDPSWSMTAATTLAYWATGSVWAMFFLFAIPSFFGKWALYAGLRDELRPADPRMLMVAVLYVPSCVFWTAGLVKEAFAIAGLGVLFRGTQLLLRGFSLVAPLMIIYGVSLVGAFKPFFLFPFVIAVAVWILFAKVKQAPALAPFLLVAAAVIAVGGLAVLGARFKQFSVDNVAESLAHHQRIGQIEQAGSNYSMGDPNARSISGQIAFAPLALVTTLFRPLPFEIHNATSMVASSELFVFTVLAISSLRKLGGRAARSLLGRRPVTLFMLLFVLVSATGVGLATSNFGTLSRYRTPILPFYTALIVALRQASTLGTGAPVASAAAPAQGRRRRGLEGARGAHGRRLL